MLDDLHEILKVDSPLDVCVCSLVEYGDDCTGCSMRLARVQIQCYTCILEINFTGGQEGLHVSCKTLTGQ